MWFSLNGDARLGRCATDACGGQPTWRLEAGGTGSDYCSGCKAEIDSDFAEVVIACSCGQMGRQAAKEVMDELDRAGFEIVRKSNAVVEQKANEK